MNDETILGFDGAADDTSIVVMHRRGGVWRVESTDGPDAGDLARLAERLVAALHPPRPWPAGGLAEQVRERLAAHPPTPLFELTDWQRDVIHATYARLAGSSLTPALKTSV